MSMPTLPISSKNTVPEFASSIRPCLVVVALVNDPFMWPKSSLSNSVPTSAPQSTTTKGRSRRKLFSQTARATTSLPVPDSPAMSTVLSVGPTRAIRSRIRWIGSLEPTNARCTPSASISALRSWFSSDRR